MNIINIKDEELIKKLCSGRSVKIIDEKAYKLITYPEYEFKEFLSIINFIKKNSDLDICEVYNPFLLFDKESNKNKFGMIMEYLKGYINLEEFLVNKNITIKINLFLKIGELLKDLYVRGAIYTDIHEENVMIDNKKNIKLIDLDALRLKRNISSKECKFLINERNRDFLRIILDSFFEDDFVSSPDIDPYSEKLKLICISNDLRDYIKGLDNGEASNILVTDFKDDFDPELIRFNKKILKRTYNGF